MIGVVADGGVQTGCVRRGRVLEFVVEQNAMGRKSDCASSKVMALRTRELHIVADTTTKTESAGLHRISRHLSA